MSSQLFCNEAQPHKHLLDAPLAEWSGLSLLRLYTMSFVQSTMSFVQRMEYYRMGRFVRPRWLRSRHMMFLASSVTRGGAMLLTVGVAAST
jgi:hypothetical protein